MSASNATARKRKNVTIKDSLRETAGHLRDLLIAPKIRGEIRDAERERAIEDMHGKTASLTIKKRRKAA
jgi:hypothetical protein